MKATSHSADKVAGHAAGWSNFTDSFVAKDREGWLCSPASLVSQTDLSPLPWGESRLEGPAPSGKEALLEPFQPPLSLPHCSLTHFYTVDTTVCAVPPYHLRSGICLGGKQQALQLDSAGGSQVPGNTAARPVLPLLATCLS